MDEVIANVLRLDVTSTAASSFVDTYPQYFSDTSQVPAHFYKSLCNIWLGSDMATSVWANYITTSFGMGNSRPDGIEIIPTRVLESIKHPDSIRNNAIGAEYAEMVIYLKIPGKPTIDNKIRDAELRIRRLIDWNYRGLRNQARFFASVSTDNTINPDQPIKCQFREYITYVNEKQLGLIYGCDYSRLFLK